MHLIDVMMVEDAVEVLVDVIEHVHHLHGCAVMAEGREAHNVTEVDGHLVIQLRLHTARLLQRANHRPKRERQNRISYGRLSRQIMVTSAARLETHDKCGELSSNYINTNTNNTGLD